MKRRGIAIAAAVAVAGGSLATANYAMAVEADELEFNELHNELAGTNAGNVAADTANKAATAIKNGATDDEVRQILQNGLKSAAGVHGADFSKEDLEKFNEDELQAQLQGTIASAKQTLEAKKGRSADLPSTPQAPAQSPEAKWASPAPAGKYSPQRLEAEFGKTAEGKIAEETAKAVAQALEKTANKQEIENFVKEGLRKAGFKEAEISQHSQEIDTIILESFQYHNHVKAELEGQKHAARVELSQLRGLNPLQRQVFQDQINSARKHSEINLVVNAAKAEDKNPVQQFAPVPGQKSPGKTGEKTDVEKALEYTKQEALKKLEGFGFLTPQQKDAYTKAVKEATEVYQVEAAFETGEAKNKANEEAKNAKNFVGKALARTKQLALKQLDEMTGLNHEQKREARKKIVDADQVYKVEAAFHTAEKLNSAKK